MSSTVIATVDYKAAQAGLRALAKMDLRPGLEVAGQVMVQASARGFRTMSDPATGTPWRRTSGLTMDSRPGGGGGGKTLQDTNLLFKSVVSAKPIVNKLAVSIGSNRKGANVHQTGEPKFIRPTHSKLLAIPMTREAKKAGGARAFWARAEAAGRQVFIQKAKSGKLYIFATLGSNNADFEPVFKLAPFVKTAPRPFLGLNAADHAKIRDIFVELAIRAAKTGSGAA
jgi:phage gpG-like protein